MSNEASPELQKRRADSLVKLHEALEEFGLAWESGFSNRDEMQAVIFLLSACVDPIVKLHPTKAPYLLACMLDNYVEFIMAALAER